MINRFPRPDAIEIHNTPQETDPWDGRKASNYRKTCWTIQRDGPLCYWCHQPLGTDYTLEHVRPKALGGSDTPDNWAVAHARCNNERHEGAV